ncbi:hypothetical protein BDB00DRAFT_405215 [Zychaea mexicana]|uniref:uncharacterized protein n=1 Tax=Zychaea mexicana TaxID=64656 RepID=UPI0022FEB3E1|nr:uncharacterized protein BDB00DRAFT_405215 [Zychaea mexicana]KAI9493013.1 hypothetical protein BDB00DRAFT_405215 [Zychaea mexicana]
MLHFFYIVRLAQQGFFSVISSSFPDVEIDAIVYLCDKLVGSSLFAVKDGSTQVRETKQNAVFDLLRKLHSGSAEVVGEGYSTTFQQMKNMVHTLIESSLSQVQQQPSSSSTTANGSSSSTSDNTQQQEQQQWPLAPPNAPPPTTQHCAPPVWLVVPFNSMIDMSALSLYPANNTASKVSAPAVPNTATTTTAAAADTSEATRRTSETAPIATTAETTTAQGEEDRGSRREERSEGASPTGADSQDDEGQHGRSDMSGRGGGRGERGRGRGRGYGRGRGRGGGEGGRGGGGFHGFRPRAAGSYNYRGNSSSNRGRKCSF